MSTLRPAREPATAAPRPEARTRPAEGLIRRAYWWQWRDGRRYFMLVYGLAMLGLVYVFSSSFPEAGRPNQGSDPSAFFRHHLAALVLGLVAMLAVSLLRPVTIAKASQSALALGLVLMTLTLFIGETSGGARCWLRLGPIRFQPSEITKAFYIVWVGAMLARGRVNWQNWQKTLLPLLVVTGVIVVILIEQRDLGMAMLIMGIALGMAILGGLKLRYWMPLALGISALGLAVAHSAPYRWARVLAWLDLPHHRSGVGYHIYGMLISLARGGPLGTGFGLSRDKWTTLPVPHTDSIFCVIGGELGLWGGLAVLALLTLLGVWAFGIARRSPHRLGWFLAAGSGLALTLQAFINLAVATATIPVTGLTLPFISYGGTSLVSCLVSAGIVLAVASEPRARAEV